MKVVVKEAKFTRCSTLSSYSNPQVNGTMGQGCFSFQVSFCWRPQSFYLLVTIFQSEKQQIPSDIDYKNMGTQLFIKINY